MAIHFDRVEPEEERSLPYGRGYAGFSGSRRNQGPGMPPRRYRRNSGTEPCDKTKTGKHEILVEKGERRPERFLLLCGLRPEQKQKTPGVPAWGTPFAWKIKNDLRGYLRKQKKCIMINRQHLFQGGMGHGTGDKRYEHRRSAEN